MHAAQTHTHTHTHWASVENIVPASARHTWQHQVCHRSTWHGELNIQAHSHASPQEWPDKLEKKETNNLTKKAQNNNNNNPVHWACAQPLLHPLRFLWGVHLVVVTGDKRPKEEKLTSFTGWNPPSFWQSAPQRLACTSVGSFHFWSQVPAYRSPQIEFDKL